MTRAVSAAAELTILHARARLRREAKVAYALDLVEAGNELATTRDVLGRMVMQLLLRRQAEARP
jgi:hypothetical protein